MLSSSLGNLRTELLPDFKNVGDITDDIYILWFFMLDFS